MKSAIWGPMRGERMLPPQMMPALEAASARPMLLCWSGNEDDASRIMKPALYLREDDAAV